MFHVHFLEPRHLTRYPRIPPLSHTTPRVKAELLSREKENDTRLTNARKSLDLATARSAKMREQYEEKAKRDRVTIKRLTKQVEEMQTEAEETQSSAEQRHAEGIAIASGALETEFKRRERELIEKLKLAREKEKNALEKTPARFDEMVTQCETYLASTNAETAAREHAERTADVAETALRTARREMAAAVTSNSANWEFKLAETLREVEKRVRQTTDALRDERDLFRKRLFESREREAAMSRVLTEQAQRLLEEGDTIC